MPKKERHKKDPKRVAAGRKAWARMSASAKAAVKARLAPFRKHKGTKARASHGAGHATHHSGGGSTTKNKPKPRLAVYAGGAIGALSLGKNDGGRGFDVVFGDHKQAAANLAQDATLDPVGTLGKGGLIAAAGALASAAADWLGINRALAKARAPWRF